MKGLPGHGPWRILDGCRAPKHNTLRAYAGRHGSDSSRSEKCRCPGALALYADDKARRTASKYRPRPKPVVTTGAVRMMPVPDLAGAPCRTPRGAALVEHWQRSTGQRQAYVAKSITWMCERRCPVRDWCGLFVQVNEQPAGSWGNVYAGRTIADRKRDAERRIATRDASRLWPCWPIAESVLRRAGTLARSDVARDHPRPADEPPRPPAPRRAQLPSDTRGALRKGQKRALGYLAGRPWGELPKSDNTWRALVIRGLIARSAGGITLTDAGIAMVIKLDAEAQGVADPGASG